MGSEGGGVTGRGSGKRRRETGETLGAGTQEQDQEGDEAKKAATGHRRKSSLMLRHAWKRAVSPQETTDEDMTLQTRRREGGSSGIFRRFPVPGQQRGANPPEPAPKTSAEQSGAAHSSPPANRTGEPPSAPGLQAAGSPCP
ncbi:hypothetical protein NDU88_002158 [Pleurodeles waltl]|uniref:Uncharacterized protein n=1 Tax=Pleurodeles waltl TaxID=8319 RepID=A0AAV7P641_PLEWA|nr:hypothetical protein NDU88_002158 [Pleurodeles waltl]